MKQSGVLYLLHRQIVWSHATASISPHRWSASLCAYWDLPSDNEVGYAAFGSVGYISRYWINELNSFNFRIMDTLWFDWFILMCNVRTPTGLPSCVALPLVQWGIYFHLKQIVLVFCTCFFIQFHWVFLFWGTCGGCTRLLWSAYKLGERKEGALLRALCSRLAMSVTYQCQWPISVGNEKVILVQPYYNHERLEIWLALVIKDLKPDLDSSSKTWDLIWTLNS